jgi:hypothetical protein
MTEGAKLHSKRINHGRSDIWLEAEGRELTPRRNLATNEVVNVVRRHCAPEVFEAFYKEQNRAVGHTAQLDVPNLDAIAAELTLETSG